MTDLHPHRRRARPTGSTCSNAACSRQAAATAARTPCAMPRARRARATFSIAMRRTIRSGPHDQPQSMCPAFGSLRVGLRMRRTATVLSGSACCVYGLTFTSHFYGARRTVGYVPFSSETLVTGKLFEDIKEAVEGLADPEKLRHDHRHQPVRPDRQRRAAAAAARPDQRRAHNRHRRAGLRHSDPCRSEGRARRCHAQICARGSRGRPRRRAEANARTSRPSRCWAKCFPPIRSASAMMLEPLGLAAGPVVPTREWRELYAALDCAAVAAIHPFYTASVREFEAAGRSVIGSAPVGRDGTAAWLDAIGDSLRHRAGQRSTRRRTHSARHQRRARRNADQGSHHGFGL